MSEFILKVCKSFRRRVDTKIERKKKWWSYGVNLLFCVYLLIFMFIFLNLKLNCFIIELFIIILEYS